MVDEQGKPTQEDKTEMESLGIPNQEYPCIFVKDAKGIRGDQIGQIVHLSMPGVTHQSGITIDDMLEFFKQGTGHLFQYEIGNANPYSVIYRNGTMYHPEYVKA